MATKRPHDKADLRVVAVLERPTKRPRVDTESVETKAARKCTAGADGTLCSTCEVIDARVRDMPGLERSEFLEWILTHFIFCEQACATFLEALEVNNDDNNRSITTPAAAAAATLPSYKDIAAWKKREGFAARIALLQQRFTPATNVARAHARLARTRTDFTSTRHDYYIDGKLRNARQGWYSVSSLLHFLFPPFDAGFLSRRSAEAAIRDLLFHEIGASDRDKPLKDLWAMKPLTQETLAAAFPHANEPDDKAVKDGPLPLLEDGAPLPSFETIVDMGAKSLRVAWDRNRDRGSDKHGWYDAWLQHRRLPVTADAEESAGEAALSDVPLGFFCAMAMLAEAGYDVEGTEVTIFDEEAKFLGQVDLLLRHRETRKLLLADFKNCKDADLAAAGNPRGIGVHPFTASTPDSKLEHYRIQLGAYWHVLNRLYYPGGEMEHRALLLNFRPSEPDVFYPYWINDLPDMAPLWALLPWKTDDPRHTAFAPGAGVKRLVAPVPDDDPRCVGPTTRCGAPRLPTPANVVWTGTMYPSAKARADSAKTGTKSLYDLPESIYKHPWRWFGPPKPGAYEFYEQHFLADATLLSTLPDLIGKKIACWCTKPEDRCQADVLVKYANLLHHGAITLPPSVADFFT